MTNSLTITFALWIFLLLGLYAFFLNRKGKHEIRIGRMHVKTTSTAIALFFLAVVVFALGLQNGLTPLDIIGG